MRPQSLQHRYLKWSYQKKKKEVILHTNICAIIKSEFGFYSCFIGKYEEPVSLCKLSLT